MTLVLALNFLYIMGRFKQRKKSSTSNKRDFVMKLYENLKKNVDMIKKLITKHHDLIRNYMGRR